MKKLAFFSLLVVVLMFAFVSCSKDEGPSPGQEQATFDVVFSGVTVIANYQNVTPPNQTKTLDAVLSVANKDKAKYVNKAEIQYNDSYVTIQGLNAGESLSRVTINLLDGSSVTATFNLGKVDANEDGSVITNSTNDCMTFLNSVTNSLASKKSITLQVTLNGGDKDITNLSITLHTKAIFSW